MADVKVTCIRKPHPQSPHEHITHLGNPSSAGGGWIWTREQVIRSIDEHTNTFYVLDPKTNRRADIAVVRTAGHPPYVRTHADGVWTDNLLALNQCLI